MNIGRFKHRNQNEWLDWLADDPVPASLRARMRAKEVQKASRPIVRRLDSQQATPRQPNVPEESGARSVSINIHVPSFKKPQVKLPKKLSKVNRNQWLLGSVMIAIVVVGIGTTLLLPDKKAATEEEKGVLSQKTEKPTFAYSLPEGDEENVEGGVRYDTEKKVVNFQDSIGGVIITVSQQPLPGAFKDDTDNKVKKLAEDFAANEVLSTANPTAYLGTSVKGPQTVIFSKKDLLVFIQSSNKIDNHDWAEYITNFK